MTDASHPTGGDSKVRTSESQHAGSTRAGRVLETVLVCMLTLLLLAIGAVAFPALLGPRLRDTFGLASAQTVLGSGTGGYKFLVMEPGTHDVPVTYDSCKPLHYVINFNGAPARFADGQFIQDAVARISQASGLRFTYDGTSTLRRQTRSYESGPILFSFDDVADDPKLDGAAAIGGSAIVTHHGHRVYSTGEVTFERNYFAKIATWPYGEQEARAIALHEIGHVLGLDHVSDTDEIMNPSAGHVLDLGPGDLAGLRILGSGPCY